jgi:hypothetical protein
MKLHDVELMGTRRLISRTFGRENRYRLIKIPHEQYYILRILRARVAILPQPVINIHTNTLPWFCVNLSLIGSL